MFREIILSILCLLGVYYLVKYVKYRTRYYSLLMKLPGPKRRLFIGNLLYAFYDDGTIFRQIRQWSRQYGPLYLLSTLYFFVANVSGPDEFEVITSSMKQLRKGRIYNMLHNWLGTGLLTSTGSQWQTRRKILTPAFHFSILRDFINIFHEETDKLVEILKGKVGEPINVIPLISQCTLGAIVETSMGFKLDLQKESDNNYVESIHKIGKIPYQRVTRPWNIFRLFYLLSGNRKLEHNLIKTINGFTNKIIKNREDQFEKIDDISTDNLEEDHTFYGKKKLAMLDLLLNAKVTEGIIDDEGIKDEVNTIMFEGHDTTATAIYFLLMLLANHKNVQDRVYDEVIENLQENEKHLGWNELNDLKYMECVIKEGLRLYPSVPFIARDFEEDLITKNGIILPKDTHAFIHIFDIHRNPNYWPEPEKFDPDRFLPENCVNRHPFAYVPFSAGPRNCIGQRFAMLEIKAVLSGILKNFILEPVDTPETIVLVPNIVLRPLNDSLFVKFIKRF